MPHFSSPSFVFWCIHFAYQMQDLKGFGFIIQASSWFPLPFASSCGGDGDVWNILPRSTPKIAYHFNFLTSWPVKITRMRTVFFVSALKNMRNPCVVNPHLSALSLSRHRQDDHRRVDDLWLVEALDMALCCHYQGGVGLGWVGPL